MPSHSSLICSAMTRRLNIADVSESASSRAEPGMSNKRAAEFSRQLMKRRNDEGESPGADGAGVLRRARGIEAFVVTKTSISDIQAIAVIEELKICNNQTTYYIYSILIA